MNREAKQCACGCGGATMFRYVRGHNTKNGKSGWLGREKSNTAKAIVSPRVRDIAWAAGFLEGEGSFHRTFRGQTEMVVASQVQREPLERLLAMFGGRIIESRAPAHKGRLIYRWFTNGSRARGILMTLFGLMSPRRKEQMRVALVVA